MGGGPRPAARRRRRQPDRPGVPRARARVAGHVVDFIDYFGLFIGNVADIAIVVGAGIIMVLSFRGTSLAGPVHHPEHADE